MPFKRWKNTKLHVGNRAHGQGHAPRNQVRHQRRSLFTPDPVVDARDLKDIERFAGEVDFAL